MGSQRVRHNWATDTFFTFIVVPGLDVGDGNNTYIEYEGVTYEFGDSIDQVLNMQSSLQTYSEFLDAFRNINRFKDRTFYISLLAMILELIR